MKILVERALEGLEFVIRLCKRCRQSILQQRPIGIAKEFSGFDGIEGIGGRDWNFFAAQVLHKGQQLIATGALLVNAFLWVTHQLYLDRGRGHEFGQLAFSDFDVFLIFEQHIQRVEDQTTVEVLGVKQHEALCPIDRF